MARCSHADFLHEPELRKLYERGRGPVAFVDQSYRLPGPLGPAAFYMLAGSGAAPAAGGNSGRRGP